MPDSVAAESVSSAGPSSSGRPSSGNYSFGTISMGFSNPNQCDEYVVTTYNPTLNKLTLTTETVKGQDLFKDKKVFFQNQEVNLTEHNTTKQIGDTNQGVQGCVQGVNPNPTPVFTRFEAKAFNGYLWFLYI